jgi:hypothetical protein
MPLRTPRAGSQFQRMRVSSNIRWRPCLSALIDRLEIKPAPRTSPRRLQIYCTVSVTVPELVTWCVCGAGVGEDDFPPHPLMATATVKIMAMEIMSPI